MGGHISRLHEPLVRITGGSISSMFKFSQAAMYTTNAINKALYLATWELTKNGPCPLKILKDLLSCAGARSTLNSTSCIPAC